MNFSLVKCLVINLSDHTTRCLEWERAALPDQLGSYGICSQELAYVWEEDPDAVALMTGPLTGMTIPGAGGMSWYDKEGGKTLLEHTEARFGAMLRLSGWDHLIVIGSSDEPVDLFLEDGKAVICSLKEYQEIDSSLSLLKKRPEQSSIVMMVSADGLKEDPYFNIGSKRVASKLAQKGIKDVIVTGSGALMVADPEALIRQTVTLCSYLPKNEVQGRRICPARYLSVNHSYKEGENNNLPELPFAFLGLCWDSEFPQGDAMEAAAGLLNSCMGNSWSKQKLKQIRNQIERGLQEYGGTVL